MTCVGISEVVRVLPDPISDHALRMQATIGVSSLKSFTKSLACLCRYGDEVTVNATPEWLSLSVVGINRTSFCRFKFLRTFFDRYRVGKRTQRNDGTEGNQRGGSEEVEELPQVVGLIMGKLLLSVFRGTGTEKSPDRCQIELVEGVSPDENADDGDSIETRLLLKLHYKHGVVKTHTFALASSSALIAPALPSNSEVSTIQIGGRTLKELVDHFHKPERKGGSQSEPLLIWQFQENKTTFKTENQWNSAKGDWIGRNANGKGKRSGRAAEDDDEGSVIYSSLNSQLSLEQTEFDTYEVYYPPVTLGLYMKELSATMTVAEALGADITARFTAHGLPIFFSIDSATETYNCFCALSTKVIPEGDEDGIRPAHDSQQRPTSNQPLVERKRPREMDMDDPVARAPSKRRNPPVSGVRSRGVTPLSLHPQEPIDGNQQETDDPSFANVIISTQRGGNVISGRVEEEPLFLPMSRTVESSQILQDAGLGDLEAMTQRELQDMLGVDLEMELDDETNGMGEMRTDFDGKDGVDEDMNGQTDDWSVASQFPATQRSAGDAFTPLFDD